MQCQRGTNIDIFQFFDMCEKSKRNSSSIVSSIFNRFVKRSSENGFNDASQQDALVGWGNK